MHTSLSIQEIVSFCLNATFTLWTALWANLWHIYGSRVSVTIANLVIEDVEDRALASSDVSLRFWKRYVDDSCTALPASSWPGVSQTPELHSKPAQRECALPKNGYPKKFRVQATPPSLLSLFPPSALYDAFEHPKATICLPYVYSYSGSLRTTEEGPEVCSSQDCDDPIYQTLKQISTPMPCHPKHGEIWCVLYCIPCAECPATIVGVTKRKLCKKGLVVLTTYSHYPGCRQAEETVVLRSLFCC